MADFPKSSRCAIFSLAAALNLPVSRVWATTKHRFNTGMTVGSIQRALSDLKSGYTVVTTGVAGKSFAVIMSALGDSKGAFLVFTKTHVVGVRDGRYVDTWPTPDDEKVVEVYRLGAQTAKSKMSGKYVSFTHTQNGETLRLAGIFYKDDQVFVRAKNGEGLLPGVKNIKLHNRGVPPAELKNAFVAYMKKQGIVW